MNLREKYANGIKEYLKLGHMRKVWQNGKRLLYALPCGGERGINHH